MDRIVQLDRVDCAILRVLQRKGDTSNAALAEQVGASPASCWRRIRALETAGVLGGSVRIVDPHSIGLGLDVICQVRMKSHDTEMRRSFEEFINSHPEIMECFTMSGEWDYLLRIVVADVRNYERFLMRELLHHPAVAGSTSHFALSRIKYTTELPVQATKG